MTACDCDPIVHDDGSRTHEPACAVYPWCPHEAVAATCLIPCGCPCGPCRELEEA